jgi:hypothetical protein
MRRTWSPYGRNDKYIQNFVQEASREYSRKCRWDFIETGCESEGMA